VDCDHLLRRSRRGHVHSVQRDDWSASAAFVAQAGSSVIDNDTPHQSRAEGEKVYPARCRYLGMNKPQIGFVHQFRGPQRLVGTFQGHPPPGQRVQLLIDERHELVHGFSLALAPLRQQGCDVGSHVRA